MSGRWTRHVAAAAAAVHAPRHTFQTLTFAAYEQLPPLPWVVAINTREAAFVLALCVCAVQGVGFTVKGYAVFAVVADGPGRARPLTIQHILFALSMSL